VTTPWHTGLPPGPLSDRVLAGLLDLVYKNALPANITVIIAGMVTLTILNGMIDTELLLVWYSLLSVTALLRIYVWRSYETAAHIHDSATWLNRYIFGTLAVGTAWGGLGLLLISSSSELVYYPVLLILLAVIAMSVPVLSACMQAFLAYIVPQVVFLTLGLFIAADSIGLIMSLGVLIYTLLTIITAQNMNRHILQSLLLQEKNQDLIDNLNSEIGQRKAAQDELVKHGEQLEELVETRTEQLRLINRDLEKEIGERRRAEENLKHLAHHDPLTNLANRLLLDARLDYAIQQAKRNNTSLAILFMDLDHFKHINDSLGHAVGDELLCKVGERLREHVRQNDTVARLGGDEFVILMQQPHSKQDVASMAEKVIELISSGFNVEGRELFISTSVGISLFPDDSHTGENMLMHADTAMYKAKKEGRSNYHFYTEALTASAYERMSLESDLRRALKAYELEVFYQPQYCFTNNQINGVEALVRWRHPEKGLLLPDKFLRLAEETGMILNVGRQVLEQACHQIAYWKNKGAQVERMAVNLSARQIQDEHLLPMVKNVLDKTGCQPSWLELEITENFIMQQTEQSMDTLEQLKNLGVHLVIDDFGTGYSSLSYLKSLPVCKLKIDRSFIRDIASDPSDAAIVSAVIAMGKSLKLEICAEGVEDKEQEAFLREQDCNQAQGYLYGKPVSAGKFDKLIIPH
jgi:diguanylate cyclase (GGDEF)-like protein